MKKRESRLICLFFVFVMCRLAVSGQTVTDSLQNQLRKAQTDTGKISILIALSYASETTEEALTYSQDAFLLGEKVKSTGHRGRSEVVHGSFLAKKKLDSGLFFIDQGIQRYNQGELTLYAAQGLYIKAKTYELANRYDSAIAFFKKALQVAQKHKHYDEWGDASYSLSNLNNKLGYNSEAIKWANEAKVAYQQRGTDEKDIADAMNLAGIIYDKMGFYSEALDKYLKAREIAIKNDYVEGEILVTNNIGVIYDNMNNPDDALKYFTHALEKVRIHNLKDDEATLLNNISYTYQKAGDTLLALQLLKQSLAIDISENHTCFSCYPLEAMGSLQLSLGKLDSAEIMLSKALNLANECQDVDILTTIQKSLGQLYSARGESTSALVALEKSFLIAKKAALPMEMKESLLEISKQHEKMGNERMALDYLKKYQNLADSIADANNVEKATRLASEYRFRKEMAEMERQQLESELYLNNQIRSKTINNRIMLLTAGFFLVIILLVARGYSHIKKQNNKLEHLNEEKNRLIGVVAHDLRNPLNQIKGLLPFMEDARRDVKDPLFSQYLDMMNSSTNKMTNMIERVLDISAIENMKLNLKTQVSDLRPIVENSLNNFQLIASQKEIKLACQIENEKSHLSTVDSAYLEQAIDNLISNAIKFSSKGQKIVISLFSDQNMEVISISDQGPGISIEDQQKIFEPYTTSSAKSTNQEKSTGLGLSIALKFIEAMNGSIAIESEIGKGTEFLIRLEKA